MELRTDNPRTPNGRTPKNPPVTGAGNPAPNPIGGQPFIFFRESGGGLPGPSPRSHSSLESIGVTGDVAKPEGSISSLGRGSAGEQPRGGVECMVAGRGGPSSSSGIALALPVPHGMRSVATEGRIVQNRAGKRRSGHGWPKGALNGSGQSPMGRASGRERV